MPSTPPPCPVPRWQLLKQQLHNVDGKTFNEFRQQPKNTLVDVRTADEFAAFHLEGATNMDYLGPDFLDKLEEMDPQKTYLVYCRSGRRSVRACTLMKNAGIKHLIHLDGGLNGLEK